MKRTIFVIALTLGLSGVAEAKNYKGGKAGTFARPAMAARKNFGKGFIVRARTIGISRDGKHALVIAKDKTGELWNVEVERSTGRTTTQLKHVKHYSLQEARFFGSDREGIPHSFVRAHAGDVSNKGLPVLSRSHKSMRVALPGTVLGTKPTNVLVGTRKLFHDKWISTEKNVRFDPADGIASTRKRSR